MQNEKSIAVISVIVENEESVAEVNSVLHCYRKSVLGRMGLPIREHNISAISVVVQAESGEINAMSGKLGRINGVTAKALYRKTIN